MAQNKAARYIKNVTKSFGYAVMDVSAELNPAIKAFGERNQDLGKALYESVRDYKNTFKKAQKAISQSDVYDFAVSYKRNLFDDLKSGNFYNKQRINADYEYLGGADEASLRDEFSDMFDDDDWEDEDFVSDMKRQKITMNTIESVGERIANANAEATIRSAEYQVAAQRESTKTLMKHNTALFQQTLAGMAAINSSLSQLASVPDIVTTHANNSSKYFETSNNLQKETNELLKQILESVKTPTANGGYKKKNRIGFNDVIDYEGMIDIKQYGKAIAQNINDQFGDILGATKFGDKSVLKSFASSPLQPLMEMMVRKSIPGSAKKAMKNFNNTLSNFFPALLSQLGFVEGNVGDYLKPIFGLDSELKKGINTSKYEKGRVAWDGVARKSLTEIIPGQLSEIISILTGEPPKIFDSRNGKMVSIREGHAYESRRTQQHANNASAEILDSIKKVIGKGYFKDAHQQNNFYSDIADFVLAIYESGGMPNFKDPEFFNKLGTNLDPLTEKIILQALNNNSRTNKGRNINLSVGRRVANERERQTRESYNAESGETDTLMSYLYNGQFDKYTKKSSSTKSGYNTVKGIFGTTDKYGNDLFFYLQELYKNTKIIANNSSSDNGSGFFILGRKPKNTPPGGGGIDIPTKQRGSEQEEYEDFRYEQASLDRRAEEAASKGLVQLDGELEDNEKISMIANQLDADMFEHTKDKSKPNLVDKIKRSKTMPEKIKKLVAGTFQFANKPLEAFASLLNSADERLYDLIYGKATKDVKDLGFIGVFKQDMDAAFEAIKENFVDPTSKFFKELFGMDTEKSFKENLFGKKGEDGRYSGGKFSGFMNNTKDEFKGFANKVKDSFVGDFSGSYANGGQVKKTGLAILSEGEYVVPSELNPFYHGKTDKAQQMRNENRVANKFFGKFAFGGTAGKYTDDDGNPLDTRDALYEYLGLNPDVDQLSDSEINAKYRATKASRKAAKGVKDTTNAMGDFAKTIKTEFYDKVKGKASKETTTTFGEVVDDIKANHSSYTPGAAVGGGIGGLLGLLVGAPLLGASVGAAVGLTAKSGTIQKALFGEEDKDGEMSGGLFGKKVSTFLTKKLPGIAKYSGAGMLAGALLPGGPIVGAIVGSAVGFAAKSQKFQDMIFGKDEEKDKDGNVINKGKKGLIDKNKLKKKLPKATAGAIIGLLANPIIPGGPIASLIVGSAIGFASDTENFKTALFGRKTKDGGREGGLFENIRQGVIIPFTNFFKEQTESIKDWFEKKIKKPVEDAIDPINKHLSMIAKGLKGMVTGHIKKGVKNVGKWLFNNSALARGVRHVGGDFGRAAIGTVKGMAELPFAAIGGFGNYLRSKDILKGNADYMTAEERNAYYEKYLLGNGGRVQDKAKETKDKFGEALGSFKKGRIITGLGQSLNGLQMGTIGMANSALRDVGWNYRSQKPLIENGFNNADKVIAGMDVDQLKDFQSAIGRWKDAATQNKLDLKQTKDDIKTDLSYTRLTPHQTRKLTKLATSGSPDALDDVKDYLSTLNISEETRKDMLKKMEAQIKKYNDLSSTKDDQAKATKLSEYYIFKKYGIRLTDKNADKLSDYIKTDLNARMKENEEFESEKTPEDKVANTIVDENEKAEIRTEKRHSELISKINFLANIIYDANGRSDEIKFQSAEDEKAFNNYKSKKSAKDDKNDDIKEDLDKKAAEAEKADDTNADETADAEPQAEGGRSGLRRHIYGGATNFMDMLGKFKNFFSMAMNKVSGKMNNPEDDGPKDGAMKYVEYNGRILNYKYDKMAHDFLPADQETKKLLTSMDSGKDDKDKQQIAQQAMPEQKKDEEGGGIFSSLLGMLGNLLPDGVKSKLSMIKTLSGYAAPAAAIVAVGLALSGKLDGVGEKIGNLKIFKGNDTKSAFADNSVISAGGKQLQVDEKGNVVKDENGDYVATDGSTVDSHEVLDYTGSDTSVSTNVKRNILSGVLLRGDAGVITGTAKFVANSKLGKAGMKAIGGLKKGAGKVVNKFLGKQGLAEEAAEFGTKSTFLTYVSTLLEKIPQAISKIAGKLGKIPGIGPVLEKLSNGIGVFLDKVFAEISTAAGKLGKKISTLASKLEKLMPAINIAYAVGVGINAYGNAASILGIVDKPTITQRLIAIVIAVVNAMIPIVGDLIPNKVLVNIFMEVAPKIGIDVSDLQKQRDEAEQTVEEYNQEHGTDYNVEEYNKKVGGQEGIFSKAADKAKSFVTNVKEKGLKNTITDYASNTVDTVKANIGKVGDDYKGLLDLAKKGDLKGLWSYDSGDNSEDNPVNGFTKVSLVGNKISLTPFALVKAAGNKIKGFITNVVTTTKNSVINNAQNYMDLYNLSKKGDIKGLWDYQDGEDSEDNPVNGFTKATLVGNKVALSPITLIRAAGNKLKEFIGGIIDSVKATALNITQNAADIAELANEGDIGGVISYQDGEDSEDNPVNGFTKMALFGAKMGGVVVAAFHNVSDKIKAFIHDKIGNKESIMSAVNTISDMKDYAADGDLKSIWKEDPDDDGTIISKISGIALNLSKPIFTVIGIMSKLMKPVKDAVDKVKDKAGDVTDFVLGDEDSVRRQTIDAGIDTISGWMPWNKNKEGGRSGLRRRHRHGGASGNFISQFDGGSYGDSSYADEGCAPASAAMLINQNLGGNAASLQSAGNYAVEKGYKVDGDGTKPGYFKDIMSQYGMDSDYTSSKSSIMDNLQSGQPTILLGKDSSNTSKANSPFGSNPHYVVATGTDNNGNVVVNDPESNGPGKVYNKSILNKVSMGVSAKNGGASKIGSWARGKVRRHLYGGRAVEGMTSADSATRTAVNGNSNSIKANDTRSNIWAFLKSKGCSDFAAAAIMGNIGHESGGFKPDAVERGNNGEGFGLCQWSYNRKTALMAYANQMGKPATSLEVQLNYLWQELTSTESTWISMCNKSYGSVDGFLKSTSDLGAMTDFYCDAFERPKASTANKPARRKYAQEAYNDFSGKNISINFGADGGSASTDGTSSDGSSGATTGDGSTGSSDSSSSSGSLFGGIFNKVMKSMYGKDLISGLSGAGLTFGDEDESDGASTEAGSISGAGDAAGNVASNVASNVTGGGNLSDLVEDAKSYSGKLPYVWGAQSLDSATGADCSGFVKSIFAKHGVNIGARTAQDMYSSDQGTAVDQSQMQPGDLIFFKSNGRAVGHVGIYAGNNQMVHESSSKKNVTVSDLTNYPLPVVGVKRFGGGSGLLSSSRMLTDSQLFGGASGLGDDTSAPTGSSGGSLASAIQSMASQATTPAPSTSGSGNSDAIALLQKLVDNTTAIAKIADLLTSIADRSGGDTNIAVSNTGGTNIQSQGLQNYGGNSGARDSISTLVESLVALASE